ncbi:12449_t:CDS:2 [Entrophospora sp. SA101]|nr:6231_t:CDS:2 [Entrophospora sp. SA101]CAJ0760333.1 12449_t:CDS:2 [Entrophospora sp. SA101]CAJ0823468.1 12723_t:CDS:2 [Entrophospora sp. SA101]CAJ0899211.1 10639_t:CDS:2 [Entrophospora sp. SA101]
MCITKVISHITNIEETPKNDSFLMNAIGVVSTTFRTEGLMSHLIIFYPKDPSVETKIQRIKKDDVVRVAGKFTIEEKIIEDHQVTFIKWILNAYHKTTEKHLEPISKKLNRGHYFSIWKPRISEWIKNDTIAKIAQQIIGNNNPTNETKERKEQNPKTAQLAVS